MNTTCRDPLGGYYQLLAAALVAHPDELAIKQYQSTRAICLTVSSNPDDHGRLIGSHGRMVKACETLLRESALVEGRDVRLTVDSLDDARRSFSKFEHKKGWGANDNAELTELLYDVATTLYHGDLVIDSRNISRLATAFTLRRKPHREDLRETELGVALSVWFESVGRNRGRVVYLDIV